jgi:hypothetical protein
MAGDQRWGNAAVRRATGGVVRRIGLAAGPRTADRATQAGRLKPASS